LTVYAKVAVLPLVKVNVAVPTLVPTTLMGLNGTALNAGPVVRNRVPEYVPGPDLLAVTQAHFHTQVVRLVCQCVNALNCYIRTSIMRS
jgi:hypothetical protein